MRAWLHEAVRKIEADSRRSSDTHLVPLPIPHLPDIHLYFKDESTHPTGSLKHRLARSLFLHALVSGKIAGPQTPVIEASSGSTAVSEAYFARLLGLRFLAVMPRRTSPEKVRRIQFYGGECVFVEDPREDRACAERLASELHGCFLDQFTHADTATDWRGNNNIAESLFAQMEQEPHPIPRWIVCGAGTGGTSATIGRYVRYRCHNTQVCVVDPETSVFHEFYATGNRALTRSAGSGLEGIGRPRVEPSFVPEVIDRMVTVPDVASFAAIHFLETVLGRRCGGSTGTNLFGVFTLISEMHRHGEAGSVVTLICDSGELYRDTYYNPDWLRERDYDLTGWCDRFRRFWGYPDTGFPG
ncbi:MAG: PLP-dependent cysteine synthase family protein [Armatimonadaceae bacterium]